jgi:ABC-type transport system, involved in lipoprotein release, permease component
MAVILTVVAVFILSGFTINTAVDRTQERVQRRIGANVTLEFDAEKALAEYQKNNAGQSGGIKGETIPIGTVKKISESSHITGYNFVMTTSGIADNFKPSYDEDIQKQMQEMLKNNGRDYEAPNLAITGSLDTSLLDVFVSGEYNLIKGQHIKESDSGKNLVLIEETLADKNHLDVGDMIKLHWHKDTSKKLELKITGIYRAPAVDNLTARYAVLNPVNNLLVSYKDAGVLGNSQVEEVDSVTYYLDSPDNIVDFENHVKKYVDMDVFKLTTDEEAYKGITGPLKNVSAFATGMTVVIIVSACFILGLVILLSLRNRKREFGILLAVGEARSKIISQMLIEALIPMCIALAVAIPLSNLTAGAMGEKLLRNEVQNAQMQNQSSDGSGTTVVSTGLNGSAGKALDEKAIENIDISASSYDYMNFILVYTLIVLLAVIFPLMSILRLNPKSILLKQG